MPFITIPIHPKQQQLTFEDILFGAVKKQTFNPKDKQLGNTKTVFKTVTYQHMLENCKFPDMLKAIKDFNQKYDHLINIDDKSRLYDSFSIPKKSGGLRQIDAPQEELKDALRELKNILQNDFYALHHTTAFAYIKGRSTIDAIKRHQSNDSRWFLKLDFANFFGSTTLDFVMHQLGMIFPFDEVMRMQGGKDALRSALSLAFLNGGLPQGTPLSPTITNLMMIPIDHKIAKEMREHTPHIVYTRYADDLLLSADLSFKWTDVQDKIVKILQDAQAPFVIKKEKTRYGSSAGRNWNLGVMLNKDNQITIGNVKKKHFKAMLFSLHNDHALGKCWDLESAQKFQGLVSYYLMVEKDNIQAIINSYTEKYKTDTIQIIKSMLS